MKEGSLAINAPAQGISPLFRFRFSNLQLFFGMLIACMLFSTHASALNAECVAVVADLTFGSDTVTGTTTGGDNPICEMFITFKQIMLGRGQVIATIAIIAVGAAALFGKITYPQALIVGLGVALFFGADTFIEAMDPSITINLNFGSFTNVDPVSAVLGMIVSTMAGAGGRAVAVVAILVLAVGALYGKVSWIQALALVAGIGLVFGSVNIIQVCLTALEGGTDGFINNIASNYVLFSDVENNPNTGQADPLGVPFLNVIDFLTGDIGVAIGTIAVMCLGFAAMMGKMTWIQAMMLATGIALVFGAADVVNILMAPLTLCSTTPNADAFTQVICGFMQELQGPMGKTLGTIAIIIMGILSMLGKISWELGFVVTIGIAVIFGADAIVGLFENSMQGTNCQGTAPSAPSTGNAIADVLCYVVMILYGPAGKALATVAVIMMGFGALVGKVSYSQAFVVAVGIAVTFGAPQIVAIILPSASTGGCSAIAGSGNISILSALPTSC